MSSLLEISMFSYVVFEYDNDYLTDWRGLPSGQELHGNGTRGRRGARLSRKEALLIPEFVFGEDLLEETVDKDDGDENKQHHKLDGGKRLDQIEGGAKIANTNTCKVTNKETTKELRTNLNNNGSNPTNSNGSFSKSKPLYRIRSPTCAICINDFETGEMLRFLPTCHHAFHSECIFQWLTEYRGCCPLCMQIVEIDSTTATSGNVQNARNENNPDNLQNPRPYNAERLRNNNNLGEADATTNEQDSLVGAMEEDGFDGLHGGIHELQDWSKRIFHALCFNTSHIPYW